MRLGICNNKGFTWIELIVVMVILGIMSAFLASRLMHSDTELAAQTEVLKTHLRYAQLRSMNSNTVWYIQLSGSAYSLYKFGDAAPKLLPGGDGPAITLPSGMTVSSGTVSFDDWGKPCIDTADPPTAQTTDRTLTVTGGSDSRSIIITKNTGFIQ